MKELLNETLKVKIEENKLEYQATCQYGEWKGIIANNITELTQIVENGGPITKEQFYKIAHVHNDIKQKIEEIQEDGYPEDILFGYNKEVGVAWYYNTVSDVHYFYK